MGKWQIYFIHAQEKMCYIFHLYQLFWVAKMIRSWQTTEFPMPTEFSDLSIVKTWHNTVSYKTKFENVNLVWKIDYFMS